MQARTVVGNVTVVLDGTVFINLCFKNMNCFLAVFRFTITCSGTGLQTKTGPSSMSNVKFKKLC